MGARSPETGCASTARKAADLFFVSVGTSLVIGCPAKIIYSSLEANTQRSPQLVAAVTTENPIIPVAANLPVTPGRESDTTDIVIMAGTTAGVLAAGAGAKRTISSFLFRPGIPPPTPQV